MYGVQHQAYLRSSRVEKAAAELLRNTIYMCARDCRRKNSSSSRYNIAAIAIQGRLGSSNVCSLLQL